MTAETGRHRVFFIIARKPSASLRLIGLLSLFVKLLLSDKKYSNLSDISVYLGGEMESRNISYKRNAICV